MLVQAVHLKMCSISWALMCLLSIKSVWSMFTLSGKQQKQNNTYGLYDEFYNPVNNDTVSSLVDTFKQNYPIKLWKYYGLFREDFIFKINAHWLKFPPPSDKTHYFLAGLYTVIMTFGMCGNALVIFMISRCKALRTPANILVMNLAVSDFLIMSEMPIFVFNSFHRGPALGEQVCRYYGFIGGLSGTVAICTLAAISLDRYYVIKFPLNRRFTSLRAKICVTITWIYGIVFSAVPLLDIGLGAYVPEGYLTSCSYDYLTDSINAKMFIFVFFVAAWFLPFILISYCYIIILSIVITRKRFKTGVGISTESTRHVKQDEKRKQEMKLALIVFLVIGLWFAAWTPYAIVSLLGICGRKDLIEPFYSMIPALFCKTASCADPFVYAFTHPRFKAEIMKMFLKSDGGASRKVWYTDANVTKWKTRSGGEPTSTYTSYDDPEIEMVAVEGTVVASKGQNFDVATNVIKENDMKIKHTPYKKPWWYRPSFSNRLSSIRYIEKRVWKNSQKSRASDDDRESDHISI